MNYGLCIGYLRDKKPCGGCFKIDDENKPKACRSCKIVNCDLLAETESGFCYDCVKYPCTRLKNLDKRYRKNYGMSMIDNLANIKDNALEDFFIDRMDQNEEITAKFMNEDAFRKAVSKHLMKDVYDRVRAEDKTEV